jgi:hypothetical protein
MSAFLDIRAGNSVAISICKRCNSKIHYADLVKDPNTLNYYCKDCVDLYDPYRMPARRAEDIGLTNPRPDERIVLDTSTAIGTEFGIAISFPPEVLLP